MARKAVQGYTEKTFYDNTKFLGVMATTDPLNEGYFRHIVNFDISDTGQSVTPRKGYLTTTLQHTDGQNELITLSDNTIVFKDNATQQHIIYDFKSNKGYVANISTYSLKNKLMPITSTIANIDWKDILNYLVDNVNEVQEQLNEIRETLTNPAIYTVVEANASEYANAQSVGFGWTLNYTYDGPSIEDVIYLFLKKYTAYQDISNAYQTSQGRGVIRYDTGYGYLYYKIVQERITEEQALEILLTHIRSCLTVHLESKVEHIVDINMVPKTILKVNYNNTFPFLLEMYYRSEDTAGYSGNTLVLDVVDTLTHPTYDPLQRNIANPNSIIPAELQTLYNSYNRPDGHVSEVGQFLYYKNPEGRYLIRQAYRNVNYSITPYFNLSPAYMALNNSENYSDSWAYRFDIISTGKSMPGDTHKKDHIFRGPWMKYNGNKVPPTPIYPDPLVNSDHQDLNNADTSYRHKQNTRYIINVVPKKPLHTSSTRYDYTGGFTDIDRPSEAQMTSLLTLYDKWKVNINKINSIITLREAINKLDDALFYVFYMGDTPKQDPRLNGTFEAGITTSTDTMSRTSLEIEYATRFMSGDELLTYLEDRAVFNANAGSEYVSFKLYPYSSRNVHTQVGTPDIITYDFVFATLEQFGTYTTRPAFTPVYNRHNGNSQYGFYYKNADGDYVIGTDIYTLRTNTNIPDLFKEGFFDNGYCIVFYMRPYEQIELDSKKDLANSLPTYKQFKAYELMKVLWESTPYTTPGTTITFGYDSLAVTYIPEKLTKEPNDIREAVNYLVYNDMYLVTWNNNVLYISEPGRHYYFREEGKKEFSEKIIKVIQFKTILLVFTVQHLYAVYLYEELKEAEDEEGKAVQIKTVSWAKQTVLYNILASPDYADAIQVFNQMVLFYSEDGQMFMIKPNTMIDNETQFSLQYFNKSVNDILANYDKYINERLSNYNIDKRITKGQVRIKVLLSVNFIKIFYYVPGYITYILNYDVINNRYTVYDTLTFTDIHDKSFIESGELYLTTHDGKMYFTLPYFEYNKQDSNVDMSITNNFKKIAISTLLDTGNLNLNNHLYKRFRDLQVVFKNLSASKLLFNVETVLDDIVSHPFYDTQLQVKDIGGTSYFVTVPKLNQNDLVELVDINQVSEVASDAFLYAINNNLFEESNILMDFGDYTSSKLLTHRTSILGMGKVFRLKLQFVSKGSYKVQSFGIVYKERRL